MNAQAQVLDARLVIQDIIYLLIIVINVQVLVAHVLVLPGVIHVKTDIIYLLILAINVQVLVAHVLVIPIVIPVRVDIFYIQAIAFNVI